MFAFSGLVIKRLRKVGLEKNPTPWVKVPCYAKMMLTCDIRMLVCQYWPISGYRELFAVTLQLVLMCCCCCKLKSAVHSEVVPFGNKYMDNDHVATCLRLYSYYEKKFRTMLVCMVTKSNSVEDYDINNFAVMRTHGSAGQINREYLVQSHKKRLGRLWSSLRETDSSTEGKPAATLETDMTVSGP